MSIADQIAALEVLASVDAQVKIIEDTLTEHRSTLNGLKGSIQKLSERMDAERASLATMEKSRNELVADVRSMNQQIEQSRDKMGRSRTEREVNAVQRELEELRKLIRDREEEIGKLTAETEATKQKVEGTEAEHTKMLAELTANEGELSSKLAAAETELKGRREERDAAMKKVPPALYRRYDMIRQKKGFALAQTTDGTCKACHMALPPQLFHRLRREPLLDQCQSCFRLIYYVPPAAPSP